MIDARSIFLTILVFSAALVVYLTSPIRTSADSRWSIHTSVSLLDGKGGDLRDYMPALKATDFYAINKIEDRYYSLFPIGTSALSVPIVMVRLWSDPDFRRRIQFGVPDHFEQMIASFYAALAAALFFWVIYARFGSSILALLSAGIFAFCTPMWSMASRALWQHGPLILMLTAAMLLLLKARQKPWLAQFVSIPLAFGFIIRPTAAIPIVVLSVYVLVRHFHMFVRFALYGIALAILLAAYNYHEFGSVLTWYYQPARVGMPSTFGEAMLGNLISPARGLLVFSPIFLLSLTGFVVAMIRRKDIFLDICFGSIVVVHWIMISGFAPWWGGHSFGPRYMSDVLPFLTYFVAYSISSIDLATGWRRWASTMTVIVLAGCSALVHERGATSWATWVWNINPENVDRDPSRLWDWRDPQFAPGLFSSRH